jgi:hypothetical protein
MYFKHSSFQKCNENPLIFFTRHMTVLKLNKYRLRTSKRARSWRLTLPSCTCSTRRAPCPTARTASAQSSFQCPASGAPPSCSARQSAGWNFSIIIYAKLIMSNLSRESAWTYHKFECSVTDAYASVYHNLLCVYRCEHWQNSCFQFLSDNIFFQIALSEAGALPSRAPTPARLSRRRGRIKEDEEAKMRVGGRWRWWW